MYILGISCFYHDAGACLLKNGKIIAAAEEERFTRRKHDTGFPINSIGYCLTHASIDSSDLNYVGFYEKPIQKFDRILQTTVENYPSSFELFYHSMPSWLNERFRIKSTIKEKLSYTGDILFIDHHTSHAASSFFTSPFTEAAILTLDGVGEWKTTGLYHGQENNITALKEIHFPNSIGLLYSTITSFLGFKVNNDEYKVMGLAAYGKPRFMKEFKKIIDIKEDGSFRMNMDFFDYTKKDKMWSKNLEELLGKSRRPYEELNGRYRDIAATLQHVTEDVIIKSANYLKKLTKSKNLCIGGGVGLNSVANGRICRETPFKNVFIQPASGDDGGAIGAATYISCQLLKNKKRYAMEHVFLGSCFSNDEIKEYLDSIGAPYQQLPKAQLLAETARLIAENNVIGWFQGRMEWGPRALGNRSILGNPMNPDMKNIVNKRVKHREEFRPFAGSVPKEDASEFFDIPCESPFMLFVFDVKENKRDVVPSITHIDGTCRVHTVTEEVNPLFHNLLKEYGAITGVPVLLNTSFNVRGEPIVYSPHDAYTCFMKTGMDCLVMEDCMINKK